MNEKTMNEQTLGYVSFYLFFIYFGTTAYWNVEFYFVCVNLMNIMVENDRITETLHSKKELLKI